MCGCWLQSWHSPLYRVPSVPDHRRHFSHFEIGGDKRISQHLSDFQQGIDRGLLPSCRPSGDLSRGGPNRNAEYDLFLGVRVTRELTSFRFGSEKSVLCGDHVGRKYSWTSWIAVAPSPTADATRLTERQRATPTANTPGMLVSKKKGSRSSLHPLGGWPERSKSRPVKIYPLASISMVPASH